MPQAIPNSRIYSLLPEEQLILAADHETQQKHHFRGFQLSFLTLDPAMSGVMGELSKECEKRLERLASTATSMQISDGVRVGEAHNAIPAEIRRQHTFVVNDDKAQQVLSQALSVADHSLNFHELLLKSCSTPAMADLLRQFVEQKHCAYQIIKELRER